MASNQTITLAARQKMLRARAGEIQLPPIVGFVFGNGGITELGEVIEPQEFDAKLGNEILRKPYDTYTVMDATTYRYECTLQENELPGEQISEIGLYDAEGDILVIKRFSRKGKDSDLKMLFWISDKF